MTILIPRPISRRAALRAACARGLATLPLPFLDCFLNTNGTALAATGAPLPVRFGTWYWGMGHTPGHAIAEKKEPGAGIAFLEETAALIPYRDQLNYFGNFNIPLDGRSNQTHASGWIANRTGTAPQRGSEIPAPTLDLLIADVIGNGSRFKTIDVSSVGIAKENYSARNSDNRAAAEISPITLYVRLFGSDFIDPNKADFKPDPAVMLQKSVLSAFAEDSRDLMRSVGAADKARLDEYFASIRQVENQLALQLKKPSPNEACTIPLRPAAPPEGLASVREMSTVIETHEIMARMLAMAVACNQTKVFNMVFTDNFANVRRNGETYTHHLLTHEESLDPKLR